jgi:hypothetical protein
MRPASGTKELTKKTQSLKVFNIVVVGLTVGLDKTSGIPVKCIELIKIISIGFPGIPNLGDKVNQISNNASFGKTLPLIHSYYPLMKKILVYLYCGELFKVGHTFCGNARNLLSIDGDVFHLPLCNEITQDIFLSKDSHGVF